ncbi:MAG: DsbA family protein, partial [bacterium]
THISNKFGDFEMFLQRTQMLIDRGAAIGIDFNMREMPKTPNTFLMHRIIQFAYQSGLQAVVKEAYMSAYFIERIDLTDLETIISIAVKCRLDEEHVRALVTSQEGVAEIKELQSNMRSMGITGVPFFIINDQYALSGAVPANQLVEAFRKINETEQV